MEVGQKVWTSTVFGHGHDSPYVYLAERTVIAVIEAGFVVQATNHPTIVVEESNLYPTKSEAAASAIARLAAEQEKCVAKYAAEIEKMQKICLQDSIVSV
jgi:hypothetical protein